MYTKQVLFIVSLSIQIAMFNTAWACHESDTGLRAVSYTHLRAHET